MRRCLPIFRTKLKNFPSTPENIIIEPLSEERIAGYFEFKDISGQPALIIRADFPRDLYLNGERTLNQMYLFLLLTGLMTGAGVKFALDRLFISRLVEIEILLQKSGRKKIFLKG